MFQLGELEHCGVMLTIICHTLQKDVTAMFGLSYALQKFQLINSVIRMTQNKRNFATVIPEFKNEQFSSSETTSGMRSTHFERKMIRMIPAKTHLIVQLY